MKLVDHNRVQLIWVSGHRETESNEIANQLVTFDFDCPFIGPKPACGISAGVARMATMD
jgi:hypothetical protein